MTTVRPSTSWRAPNRRAGIPPQGYKSDLFPMRRDEPKGSRGVSLWGRNHAEAESGDIVEPLAEIDDLHERSSSSFANKPARRIWMTGV
jgi:hypothetical protein